MNMHKQHPQRCLHSHICKFNGNNYQDCINTDCASHRYTYNFQSERDTVLDVGGILESLCKTDLYWYNKGVTEGEDVGKCRGKDCNYCGRYNEKLRHQAGSP